MTTYMLGCEDGKVNWNSATLRCGWICHKHSKERTHKAKRKHWQMFKKAWAKTSKNVWVLRSKAELSRKHPMAGSCTFRIVPSHVNIRWLRNACIIVAEQTCCLFFSLTSLWSIFAAVSFFLFPFLYECRLASMFVAFPCWPLQLNSFLACTAADPTISDFFISLICHASCRTITTSVNVTDIVGVLGVFLFCKRPYFTSCSSECLGERRKGP